MKLTIWEGSWTGRVVVGPRKGTPAFERVLSEVVDQSPRDCGQSYSTWCARTLCLFLAAWFLITVSPRTMRRYLHRIGYRLIRPVPFVASPDPEYNAKVEQLHHLKEQASLGKIILLYEDEVDLNLLPGVLRCWTKQGTQKKVMTPGQNVKRYGFGAVNFVTGHIEFLTSERKNSDSFVSLVKALLRFYEEDERPIVLILDNFRIHSSKITQKGLAPYKDRVQTFFLPTYSPCLNAIELLWKHLRRNVTHNHLFPSITELVQAVGIFIDTMNRNTQQVLSVIGASQTQSQ